MPAHVSSFNALDRPPVRQKDFFLARLNVCPFARGVKSTSRFFIDSINDINMQIPQAEPAQLNERNGNNSRFVEVTINQVTAAAKYLTKKVNKSQMCNSMVWFNSMDFTSYFLTETITYSLEQGMFPSQWKTSTITPIPKITGTNISSNFRPINVLPVDEKICENLVKDQLLKFINENNLLDVNQSVFREKHSCETLLNSLIVEWKIARENGFFITR